MSILWIAKELRESSKAIIKHSKTFQKFQSLVNSSLSNLDYCLPPSSYPVSNIYKAATTPRTPTTPANPTASAPVGFAAAFREVEVLLLLLLLLLDDDEYEEVEVVALAVMVESEAVVEEDEEFDELPEELDELPVLLDPKLLDVVLTRRLRLTPAAVITLARADCALRNTERADVGSRVNHVGGFVVMMTGKLLRTSDAAMLAGSVLSAETALL
ncbi:MAG: hypothetical protein M1829_005744 [Trizodia sp. TS-e1964]|nr:MAG: hypothetical protein M1829_005744 [Trizodia sp. TS-e1964]